MGIRKIGISWGKAMQKKAQVGGGGGKRALSESNLEVPVPMSNVPSDPAVLLRIYLHHTHTAISGPCLTCPLHFYSPRMVGSWSQPEDSLREKHHEKKNGSLFLKKN